MSKNIYLSADFADLQQGISERLLEPSEKEIFQIRLEQGWEDALRPLSQLYGQRDDFEMWLGRFLNIVGRAYAERPSSLRHLDLQRVHQPDWFQKADMVGYVAYTERFAGDLAGVGDKIPYLNELGITYLHLMPLLKPRLGANDGGYAVMDYRQVREDLGTMSDLSRLATELRDNGISLCIDLVCNHSAQEHEWAQKALAGDAIYQDYYLMFPDRTLPDQYEYALREIFPEFAPGNFSYYEEIEQWVWTTFNNYQWDLNYKNPAVFAEMLEIMLYLANQGVEVLRLDAVAFMWKRMGTDCENQPEAHAILQAFRALSCIAAPALLLKAEAIVSPPQLIPYLGRGRATNKECEIAYHNVLMVSLWSALAERKTVLATHILQNMPAIPSQTSWVTYVRCHDDIGWAITEEDAAGVGLDGFAHRAFLSDFYTGRFPGTFARGSTFQFNPKTNDRRVNGSLASLAGLEQALAAADWQATEWAIRRILLLHNLIFVFGGIPLLYMGDELGLLNDRRYEEDPNLVDDSRWIHRPFMDWDRAQERHDWQSVTGRIFAGLCALIGARKRLRLLHADTAVSAVWTHNEHVLGLLRAGARGRLLALANFAEERQVVGYGRLRELDFAGRLVNQLNEEILPKNEDICLEPYGVVWLQRVM